MATTPESQVLNISPKQTTTVSERSDSHGWGARATYITNHRFYFLKRAASTGCPLRGVDAMAAGWPAGQVRDIEWHHVRTLRVVTPSGSDLELWQLWILASGESLASGLVTRPARVLK